MLMLARRVGAEEALACGFLTEVSQDLDKDADLLVERVVSGAPLTQWAIKENLRRLAAAAGDVDDSDVISRVYGSRTRVSNSLCTGSLLKGQNSDCDEYTLQPESGQRIR